MTNVRMSQWEWEIGTATAGSASWWRSGRIRGRAGGRIHRGEEWFGVEEESLDDSDGTVGERELEADRTAGGLGAVRLAERNAVLEIELVGKDAEREMGARLK